MVPSLIQVENDIIYGRIYKMYNVVTEKVYIGSTNKTLVKRVGDHVYDYNKGTKMELYKHMREIGIKNFKVRLLESKLVDNTHELRILEQQWINRENPINLLNNKKAVKEEIEELINKLHEIKLSINN